MTVCGEKVTGVCVAGKCQHIKRCCPAVWDKYGKIKPKTNEEWIKSLDTDEFADFLEGVAFDSNFRNGIEAEYRREDKDYCYGDRPKIIKAWLKEVHHEM